MTTQILKEMMIRRRLKMCRKTMQARIKRSWARLIHLRRIFWRCLSRHIQRKIRTRSLRRRKLRRSRRSQRSQSLHQIPTSYWMYCFHLLESRLIKIIMKCWSSSISWDYLKISACPVDNLLVQVPGDHVSPGKYESFKNPCHHSPVKEIYLKSLHVRNWIKMMTKNKIYLIYCQFLVAILKISC